MDKTLTEQEIALLRRKLDLLLRTGQLLVEPPTGTEHCQLPGGKRSFQFAERTDESAAHGRQSLRAMRRISSHPRS